MPIESKECFTNLTIDGQLYEIYQAAQGGGGGGGVTTVTATAPITSSGGANPNISTRIATNKIVGRSTAGTGVMEELTPVGITVSAGNITGIGGTLGTVDNVVPRADGTGGFTVQPSGLIVEDAIVSFAVTGVAATDIITATGSAFSNGQPVRFTALTGGLGLSTTTNYYVINVSGATFQVSTSVGGGASLFTTNITAGTLVNGHFTQPFVAISENTTETDSALVLTPKGTGALILGPKPDGTAVGGNARGARAVDLQVSRGVATQVASGQEAIIVGGFENTATGLQSVICGGRRHSASGSQSNIGGGMDNQAITNYATVIGGNWGFADRYGMMAHTSGRFASIGDSQRARFVLRCKTTTNTAVEMALDGATAYLSIPSGKVMSMTINISGVKSDGSAVAHYVRQYAVKNVAGTSSQVYAPVTIGSDNAAGTVLSLTTNDTGDYVSIAVTGVAAETWRWVASVDAVEIAYGT